MASRAGYLIALALWIGLLWGGLDFAARSRQPVQAIPTTEFDWPTFFTVNILPNLPEADEFDPPLRSPDGDGAVISLPFGEAGHLGEDWTTAKGDAALGEPVLSVADGWVSVAQDFENAWGKVVFVCSRLPGGRYPSFVEVMYAQLQSIDVKPGELVERGQRLGAVGNANGTYPAHLHWEIRQTVGLGVGPGFDPRRDGWLNPSEFLAAHRGPRTGQPLKARLLAPNERTGWGTDF